MWKAANPSTRAPLAEVALHLNFMELDDMWRFIETFRGQALRSLCLLYISSIKGSFLRKLVEEFPLLQTLGICTAGWCRSWPFLELVSP